MDYTISPTALPVFFSSQTKAKISAKSYELNNAPITALHYHDVAELGICVSGTGETYIENKIYKFKKGCVQVLPPLVPHLSKADDKKGCSWIWISFSPYDMLKNVGLTSPEGVIHLASSDNFFSGVFSEDEHPELTASIKDIVSEAKINDDISSLAVALSISRFLVVSSRLKKNFPSYSFLDNKKMTGDYSKIAPAIEFIGANLDDGDALSENNLAKKCNLSVSSLRRLFSLCTGYSPKVFIIRSRMAYAEYLLRRSSLSVLDVSLYCGYSEISGFNRTFKAFFGVTPLKYRKGN